MLKDKRRRKHLWGQCKQPPYRQTDIVQHISAVLSPDPFKSHLSNVPFYGPSKEPMVVGREKKEKENWRKGEGEEDNRIIQFGNLAQGKKNKKSATFPL